MKFQKWWFLGGEKKNEDMDDYIEKYIAENGMEIQCGHGFNNWNNKWYEVDGKYFSTLKEAKEYCYGDH